MNEVQTGKGDAGDAGSPPYVPKLHMMNYAPRLPRRPTIRRTVSGRVMKSQTLREEIKFLESVLPIYDKRTYMACDRISLALSYAAYLEGLIAASTPDDVSVPKKTVPLISEFNLYHLTDDNKVPDATTETSCEVNTDEIKVDNKKLEEKKVEDNVTQDVLQDCICEDTKYVKDLDSVSQNMELFPELYQFPLQEIEICSQNHCWHDGSWCCCPHREEQDQLCEALQHNRRQDTSKMDITYSKMMIKKRMSSSTKTEGGEKKKANTEMTSGERKIEERARYIQLVLSRMESAVKVARDTLISDET